MQALTVVLNPNARKPRRRPPSLEGLKSALGPRSMVHVTRDLNELDELMRNWNGREENLCFYGGDGSVAHGLTAFLRHHGESVALPPVLAVKAGTINMLCSVLGLREDVDKTLGRWNMGQLTKLTEIPLLKVQVEDELPHYGFIFAWGVGFRVLRNYYGRNETPTVWDGVMAALHAFLSVLHPLAHKLPLFKRENLSLKVSEASLLKSELHTLTVGTIPRVSLGLRPFPPAPIRPGGFHFSGNGMSNLQVARHVPSLLLGMGDQRELLSKYPGQLVTGTGVNSLECILSEGFTMDGEIFELSRPSRVRISSGPTVRFWTKAE